MEDWSEEWVSLYLIEEDLISIEEAVQETQERLQVAILEEVDQLKRRQRPL